MARTTLQLRASRGATLALVATTAIIIILVAVGLFFLLKILGGNRELNNATESGNLSIARESLRNPAVPLSPGVEQENFKAYLDPQTNRMDLLTYNRAVGQALVVAMNAKADPGPAPQGVANSNTLVSALQNGVGLRLRNQLNGAGNTNNFFQIATGNTTRMLGIGSKVQNNFSDYATAYVDQTPQPNPNFPADTARNMATNLQIPLQWTNGTTGISIPAGLRSTKTVRLSNGQTQQQMFLRGYTAANGVAGLSTTPFMGVPLNPFEQPHLISQQTFAAGTSPLPSVPPNAFQSGGQVREARTNAFSRSIARSTVGTTNLNIFNTGNSWTDNGIKYDEKGPAFPLEIPLGYFIVNNTGDLTFTGNLPSQGHVLDDELDPSKGIFVDTSSGKDIFTDDQTALNQWRNHNQTAHQASDAHPDPVASGNRWQQSPSSNNMFVANGSTKTPMSAVDGHGINASGSTTACFDNNSSPGSTFQNATCVRDLTNGAFDAAYSPPGTSYNGNYGTANSLMAVEEVKCRVMGSFNTCVNISVPGGNETSGLRVYTGPDQWFPENGLPRCHISRPGTIGELFDQAADGKADGQGAGAIAKSQVESYLRQRMYQIQPYAQAGDINAIINKPVPITSGPMYIYVSPQTGKFVMDTNTPPGLSTATPDGTPLVRTRTYGTVGRQVNPPNENHIHDRLYRSQPFTNSINGTDTATLNRSSAFGNLMGAFAFSNQATGGGGYFCDPD